MKEERFEKVVDWDEEKAYSFIALFGFITGLVPMWLNYFYPFLGGAILVSIMGLFGLLLVWKSMRKVTWRKLT